MFIDQKHLQKTQSNHTTNFFYCVIHAQLGSDVLPGLDTHADLDLLLKLPVVIY